MEQYFEEGKIKKSSAVNLGAELSGILDSRCF
jgi:hypothetical protein